MPNSNHRKRNKNNKHSAFFYKKTFLRIAQMNSFVNVFPYDEKKPCSVETSQYLDNWENKIWFDYLKEIYLQKIPLHSFFHNIFYFINPILIKKQQVRFRASSNYCYFLEQMYLRLELRTLYQPPFSSFFLLNSLTKS